MWVSEREREGGEAKWNEQKKKIIEEKHKNGLIEESNVTDLCSHATQAHTHTHTKETELHNNIEQIAFSRWVIHIKQYYRTLSTLWISISHKDNTLKQIKQLLSILTNTNTP